MSKENVEIVRAVYGAFNRRDKAAYDALVAADAEVHPVPEWPENRVVLGRDAAWDFFVGNDAVWEPGAYALSDFTAGADTLVACAELSVQGKESGVPVELRFWGAFRVRDGEIVRVDFFLQRDRALEAAGLQE
jgi:ketosteroid isomerase-like protein